MVSTAAQRWRLAFRRLESAPVQPHQAFAADWTTRLVASGLPFAGPDAEDARPRLVFAAPLGAGMVADHELVDLELARRLAAVDVRRALAAALPAGVELIDLHDVWLGEPSLAGQVRRATYLVAVDPSPAPADLALAVARLVGATEIRMQRERGGRTVDVDLRPLVIDVRVADPGPPPKLEITTAFDAERGVGRPEEVVSALSRFLPDGGPSLAIASVRRTSVELA